MHFCNLDMLYAYMCMVVLGRRSSFPFLVFFLLLFFVELEHIAIEYAMKRKFMEGRIMSNWGKFNYFYNLDKLHNLL